MVLTPGQRENGGKAGRPTTGWHVSRDVNLKLGESQRKVCEGHDCTCKDTKMLFQYVVDETLNSRGFKRCNYILFTDGCTI